MDSTQNKNVYSVNKNDNNDIYGGYSSTCAQPAQNSQRPHQFLPPYGMPVIPNNMPQQLMYNSQSQPMYNIMYGPQSMYRNQNTFSSNSFPQTIDSVPWGTESCVASSEGILNSKEKYVKFDNKLKETSNNCCVTRVDNLTCSANKNFYYNKHGIMDSQWFYSANYNENQKYNELPSCSQMSLDNSECCANKSVKYCSIQKYSETDPKLYMYPNKYDNSDIFVKDYPSCSQLPQTCNLYPNTSSSCLEIDKKIMLDHCEAITNCDIASNQTYYPSATDCAENVMQHFDVQKIDDKSNNDESNGNGGESDIVVEDSDEEITDDSEEIDKDEILLQCLICNVSNSNQQFYLISSSAPLTSYSQSNVMEKLNILFGTNKNPSNNLCSACLNLINTLDHLEIQLNNIKSDLIQKYTSTVDALKLCVNKTNESNKIFTKKVDKPTKICGVHSFKCTVCEKIFSLKKFYKYHMSKHKIKSSYLCEHCGCNFVKHSNLKMHLRRHLNHSNIRCKNCKKIFTNELYRRHKCKKTNISKFVCYICGKIFKTKTNLKEHENFCSGNLPFKCFECNKRFTSSTKLKQHVQLKHDKNFVENCKICGKGFVKQSDYKSHLLKHSSEKNFKCKICNKSYKTLSNLNYHLKIHNEKLPFVCEICQKGFLRKENLESHLNIHNGLKPFNCTICDKKFASQKNLDAHLRVHKGTTKKKTCTICGKTLSHGLEEHMRTHSNVKNFDCNFCSEKFVTKGALAKHKKRKHENVDLVDILL